LQRAEEKERGELRGGRGLGVDILVQIHTRKQKVEANTALWRSLGRTKED
jgi:hypothetical protein